MKPYFADPYDLCPRTGIWCNTEFAHSKVFVMEGQPFPYSYNIGQWRLVGRVEMSA